MDAQKKELMESFLAALMSFAKGLRKKWQILLFFVVFLVLVLFVYLASCTSNHYFSINAEEMTNPRIEYHDSTTVSNPF